VQRVKPIFGVQSLTGQRSRRAISRWQQGFERRSNLCSGRVVMQGRLRVAILTPRIDSGTQMKFRRDVKRANKGYFSDQAQFSILAIVVLLSGGR